MNWGTFDLNLLIVFDAVMQERSVTRAGGRIGLSQPAMSHALNRLRYMLKDDLFIRTPDGMVPTPRAEALAQPLRNALSDMQLALEPPAFDPATSDYCCQISVDNYAAVVLAPPLVAAVSAAAPSIVLDLRPGGTFDILERLDRGDLHLAIGRMTAEGERFASTTLVDDSFVLVMRRGHPRSRSALSAAHFAALPYLEISSSGENTEFVDEWLSARDLERRIALRAPYLSTAAILSQSDLVTILSRRFAREFVRNHPLNLRTLPCGSPSVTSTLMWHRRLDQHPAHRWLRDLIMSLSKGL